MNMKTSKTKEITKEVVISEKLKLIVELIRIYPNDQELGREIRKLINSFGEK